MTAQLFDTVWAHWCEDTQAVTAGVPAALQGAHGGEAQLASVCERWILTLKVSQSISCNRAAV